MKVTSNEATRARRGLPRQKVRRQAERAVRISAVAFGRWARQQGRSLRQSAAQLELPFPTLQTWERQWRRDRMKLRARGRHGPTVDRDTRREILALLDLMGPRLGLPTLRTVFPVVARAELVELQRRYRAAYRRRHGMLVQVLRWTRAGAVWALDFTQPPCLVDGIYDRVLVVRDLASDYQLAALPTRGETTRSVVEMLRAQFAWHGAPLVLKSDNGGAFRSDRVRWLLLRHGVIPLLSPPATPRYNGSVEAGIGMLKVRAHYASARHGRVAQWSSDDLELACGQANHTTRPEGLTPESVWRDRTHPTAWERALFQETYLRYREEERMRRGLTEPLDPRQQATLERVVIGRALVESGYLLVRRRRITPLIYSRNRSKIS